MSPFLPSVAPASLDQELPSAKRQVRDTAENFLQPDFKTAFAAQIAQKQSLPNGRDAREPQNDAQPQVDKARSAKEEKNSEPRYRSDDSNERRRASETTQAERRVAEARDQRQDASSAEFDKNPRADRQADGEKPNEGSKPVDASDDAKLAKSDADVGDKLAVQNSADEELTAEQSQGPQDTKAETVSSIMISQDSANGALNSNGGEALDVLHASGEGLLAGAGVSPLVDPQNPLVSQDALAGLSSLSGDNVALGSDASLQNTGQGFDAARARLGIAPIPYTGLSATAEGGTNVLASDALLGDKNSGVDLNKLGLSTSLATSAGTSGGADKSPVGATLLQGQNIQNTAGAAAGQSLLSKENFSAALAKNIDAQLVAAGSLGEETGAKTQGLSALNHSALSGVQHLNAAARVQMPVSISFGQSGWSEMIAERSAMMAAQSIKFAELQLDPPELGQLQVKVSVNHDQASVSFVAPNAQVKEALDQTMARLKELFESQGLDLADVDVSDQSSSESQEDEGLAGNGATSMEDENAEDNSENDSVQTLNATYGIDHYA